MYPQVCLTVLLGWCNGLQGSFLNLLDQSPVPQVSVWKRQEVGSYFCDCWYAYLVSSQQVNSISCTRVKILHHSLVLRRRHLVTLVTVSVVPMKQSDWSTNIVALGTKMTWPFFSHCVWKNSLEVLSQLCYTYVTITKPHSASLHLAIIMLENKDRNQTRLNQESTRHTNCKLRLSQYIIMSTMKWSKAGNHDVGLGGVV